VRPKSGPFRHHAQQASLRRARQQAQAQAAHAARPPGRARPVAATAAGTRLPAHVRGALHEQRARQRVRGRLHGGRGHHACGRDGALQARAGCAAPGAARAAPPCTLCSVHTTSACSGRVGGAMQPKPNRACLSDRMTRVRAPVSTPTRPAVPAPGPACPLPGSAKLQRALPVPRLSQGLQVSSWNTPRCAAGPMLSVLVPADGPCSATAPPCAGRVPRARPRPHRVACLRRDGRYRERSAAVSAADSSENAACVLAAAPHARPSSGASRGMQSRGTAGGGPGVPAGSPDRTSPRGSCGASASSWPGTPRALTVDGARVHPREMRLACVSGAAHAPPRTLFTAPRLPAG